MPNKAIQPMVRSPRSRLSLVGKPQFGSRHEATCKDSDVDIDCWATFLGRALDTGISLRTTNCHR